MSDILKEALALPPEARAALAGSLLESLDEHHPIQGSRQPGLKRSSAASKKSIPAKSS
jgi:hypothetical protein